MASNKNTDTLKKKIETLEDGNNFAYCQTRFKKINLLPQAT